MALHAVRVNTDCSLSPSYKYMYKHPIAGLKYENLDNMSSVQGRMLSILVQSGTDLNMPVSRNHSEIHEHDIVPGMCTLSSVLTHTLKCDRFFKTNSTFLEILQFILINGANLSNSCLNMALHAVLTQTARYHRHTSTFTSIRLQD